MMTPQEVAASTFPKATLGGYNMTAVDVFLDKLTEDYTTIYKENAALKAKIKVLVDKMEEYHAMEDTMRSTLLTAQRMANSMISEAEEKRAALIAEAETDARVRMRELTADVAAQERRLAEAREEIDRQIALEQMRLVVAQRELAAFINGAKALCTRQMELISRLGELDVLPSGFKMPEDAQPEAAPAEPAACPATEADKERTSLPEDDETAAAMAQVAEELGGDANSLVESMRSVIDLFAAEKEDGAKTQPDGPFGIDFDDAEKLFDGNADPSDPFDHTDDDNYDHFEDEQQDATRVLNLNDLQFGRNYNKE